MKITQEQIEKGQDLYQQLVRKALEDSNFKEELIRNPKSIIEKITGKKINLPSNTKVVVLDQTDSNTLFLNIPRKLEIEELELSEDQLEMVSGGYTDPNTLGFWEQVGYVIYMRYFL